MRSLLLLSNLERVLVSAFTRFVAVKITIVITQHHVIGTPEVLGLWADRLTHILEYLRLTLEEYDEHLRFTR